MNEVRLPERLSTAELPEKKNRGSPRRTYTIDSVRDDVIARGFCWDERTIG